MFSLNSRIRHVLSREPAGLAQEAFNRIQFVYRPAATVKTVESFENLILHLRARMKPCQTFEGVFGEQVPYWDGSPDPVKKTPNIAIVFVVLGPPLKVKLAII